MSEISKSISGVSVDLDADQFIHYQKIKYPIKWTGYVNNHKVEIIQKSYSSSHIDDYDWKIFPSEHSKSDIAKVIDKY
ncbi:MAG: hypothetical protein DI539_15900 [Flavobacterium psychrophilum]|nr:MAG: hypothetical protein DI539_15900 [Flavobacterium psychrophilum]